MVLTCGGLHSTLSTASSEVERGKLGRLDILGSTGTENHTRFCRISDGVQTSASRKFSLDSHRHTWLWDGEFRFHASHDDCLCCGFLCSEV